MVVVPGLRYLKGAMKVDSMLTFSRRKQKKTNRRNQYFVSAFWSTPHFLSIENILANPFPFVFSWLFSPTKIHSTAMHLFQLACTNTKCTSLLVSVVVLGCASQQWCLSTAELGMWEAWAGPAGNGGGCQLWEEGHGNCSSGWDRHLTSSCFLSLTEAEPEVSEKAQVLTEQETTMSGNPRNRFCKTLMVHTGIYYLNNYVSYMKNLLIHINLIES